MMNASGTGFIRAEGRRLIDGEGKPLLLRGVGLGNWLLVYVVFDLHGTPGGQTGANIDDSVNDHPDLFTDPVQRNRTIALWVMLAERYKHDDIIAGTLDKNIQFDKSLLVVDESNASIQYLSE